MRTRGIALFAALLLSYAALADEPAADESTPLFEKALEAQRKGRWVTARKLFRKLLEDHPDSVHAQEALVRSDDNAYLGTVRLTESGPPERRIDVAVMGDGFTIDARDQALEHKWAKLCVDVILNEKSFFAYQDYFNFYFVRLASLEEGVDPQLTEEQRRRIEERNRRRVRKRTTDDDTAHDCKAAGPQGQVVADRTLVYKWLGIANEDVPGCGEDGLVIAFARFGVLGMGGAGVANVGRPDKSITTHEFGHAFTGLADEYTGNPNPPHYRIMAANAATTNDPEEVPWAHFLKARVKGVGIFEGGATHDKGVWRPARSCVMNAAGNSQFCPVCREANVLAIYSYVSPIDTVSPDPAEPLTVPEGDRTELAVRPMRPRTHALEVAWYVRRLEAGEAAPRRAKAGDRREDWWKRRFAMPGMAGYAPGKRARGDREAHAEPPGGELSSLGRGGKGRDPVHTFPVGRLDPGRYVVTVVVRDPTDWVLEDPLHLLTEREWWVVTITGED
jgi:hypothetical protein